MNLKETAGRTGHFKQTLLFLGLLWLIQMAWAPKVPHGQRLQRCEARVLTVIAEVRQVQGFWLLAGENGTLEPQMRNSDTETSSETIATRKMKPAVKGVGVKWGSQSKRRVGFRHLGTKGCFMKTMPWEQCWLGEEGRNQRVGKK